MLDEVDVDEAAQRRNSAADTAGAAHTQDPGDPRWMAASAATVALAACGGGGGGTGTSALPVQGPPSTPPASGSPSPGSPAPLTRTFPTAHYPYLEAKSDAEAARFLLQAQFSASETDIAAVRAQGYLPWLAGQLEAPKSPGGWDWLASKPYDSVTVDDMAWRQLMAAGDPVRQRMALALSEIFVVSATSIGSHWPDHMMAQYWDVLVGGATGNFRSLLEAVTLNPAMGSYLNTRGNQKESALGRQPDENFAREIMQLMSIGLYQLNADGSQKTASNGRPIESYTQDDVTNLARVFTGYDIDIAAADRGAFTVPGTTRTIENNAWTTRPMALIESRHSMLEAKFLGTTVPAGTPGQEALKTALDTLFNHPNVGPFIGRQLIQRLVTSNPGADYIARVAAIFADNGAGIRGDMKSVIAAVLLDSEARTPTGLGDPGFGRLREPMLRLAQWARTFGVTSTQDRWKVGNTSDPFSRLGQSPLRSPSVFNFFRPGYVPPSTAMASAGKVAPEFQIVNETSVGGYLNYMQNVLLNGIDSGDMRASYAAELALVLDPPALVRRLNLLLCAGQLSDTTQTLIASALTTPQLTAESTDAAKRNRICAAVLLVMACAEYLIQK